MIKTVVHTFMLGDVDDPDLYASVPMLEWEKTEAGKFVMTNSLAQPEWIRIMSSASICYQYKIVAYFDDSTYTFWKLKYG